MLISAVLTVGHILTNSLGQGTGAGAMALEGALRRGVGHISEIVLVVDHGSGNHSDLLVHLDFGADVDGTLVSRCHGMVLGLPIGGSAGGLDCILVVDGEGQPQVVLLIHELLRREPDAAAHGVLAVVVADKLAVGGDICGHMVLAVTHIVVHGTVGGGCAVFALEEDTVQIILLGRIGGIGVIVGRLLGGNTHQRNGCGIVAAKQLIPGKELPVGIQVLGSQAVVQNNGLILHVGDIESNRHHGSRGGLGAGDLHIEHMHTGAVVIDVQHLVGGIVKPGNLIPIKSMVVILPSTS